MGIIYEVGEVYVLGEKSRAVQAKIGADAVLVPGTATFVKNGTYTVPLPEGANGFSSMEVNVAYPIYQGGIRS